MKTKNFFGMIILPIMLFVTSAAFAGNTNSATNKSENTCTCTDCKKCCGEKCDGGNCCTTKTAASTNKKACCEGKEGTKTCSHNEKKETVKGNAASGAKAKCCTATADSKCTGTCNEKCKDCESCKTDCSKCCTKDGCSHNGCCDTKKK